MAIVRIAFGLFLMLYWYTEWRQVALFTSSAGLVVPKYRLEQPLLFVLFNPTVAFLHLYFASLFVLLACLTVGYRTRLTALALLIFFGYFNILSQYVFATSFYRLFQFTLVVLLLPGADRTFSVAMFLERGSFFAWEPVSILQQRLLALQLTFVYMAVGWQKLFLPSWQTGAVLLEGFTGRWATPLASVLAKVLPYAAFSAMVVTTKIFEVLMPLGLWVRKLQPWFFVGGCFFHTMITLTLGIWWFQVLIPMYLLFLSAEEVYEYVRGRSRGLIP